jgi:proline iminopeptidase
MYVKKIIGHSSLYIATFTKDTALPYIIFVHGGPGLNSGVLENLMVKEGIFDLLAFNLVLYDQRGCGCSQQTTKLVLHSDNLCDLDEVYKILTDKTRLTIAAIAGHSYGAKLLFDFLRSSRVNIPSIFIAIASSMLTPRINNLLLDFAYLKSADSEEYQKVLDEFDDYSPEMLWRLTERLANLFQENKTRPYFYWANLYWKEKVTKIQDTISMPMNSAVFKSVRQNLYTQLEELSFDINAPVKSLWINGFHDLIMGGASALTNKNLPMKLFFKSAHYPHIEEHKKFCEEVNVFLKSS